MISWGSQVRRIVLGRPFCSVVKLSPSEFDSMALHELNEIAERVDSHDSRISPENVELHEGVLTIEFPSGTFVLNKHGASGQIWYSSPVSRPAYFEPLTDSGKKWWSLSLNMTLRLKLQSDIERLIGEKIDLD